MQEQVTALIKNEGRRVAVEDIYTVMKKNIEEDLGDGLNYESAIARLDVAKRTLKRKSDVNGTVDLAEVDAMKKKIYEETNYTKDTDKADKAIARGAKEIIEKNVESADIKAMNNELARWYTTNEYLKLL